ncbi:MAG: FAD:protein FMN transferase [Sulfuricella sp.]|nr:FAD:protein FMN transferase [Sulfuricella sp.]
MSCSNELQFFAASATRAATVANAVIGEVQRIERRFSRYRDDSVISRINRTAGGEPLEVDEETAALLDYAASCFDHGDGCFDITSGVLRRAWNFSAGQIPGRAAIDALLPLIGWDKVEWEKPRFRLPLAGMEIDFGGIGKEYAADRAAMVCREMGVAHGFVNLGGDLCVWGPQPCGSPWLIGIRDPGQGEKILARLPIFSGGLATSGDYARCLEIDGRRYSHLLDPKSGWPVAGMRSVTVQGPSCLVAGSITTIAMLKGADGLAWLEESGLPFLAADEAGQLHSSFAFRPARSGSPANLRGS